MYTRIIILVESFQRLSLFLIKTVMFLNLKDLLQRPVVGLCLALLISPRDYKTVVVIVVAAAAVVLIPLFSLLLLTRFTD
jgi:hypothetical protein